MKSFICCIQVISTSKIITYKFQENSQFSVTSHLMFQSDTGRKMVKVLHSGNAACSHASNAFVLNARI